MVPAKKNLICFINILLILFYASLTVAQEDKIPSSVDSDFIFPREFNLCGEPIPLDNQWVWEMLDRELTISAWNKAQVFMWLKRAGRYFPYLESSLIQENMPQDIKYLVIAESGLLPRIKSDKGAVGFWQFMPGTAMQYGLRADSQIDERSNFEQSTVAALKYLKNLKEIFGTWTLAMAAFNCGEKRVQDAIKEQRQTDFYQLKLPEETERYIYQIIAAKMIMQNPGAFGYYVPQEKIYKPVQCDATWVDVNKPIHIIDFAEAIGTSMKVIRDLNPQIIGNFLPSGLYILKTPIGTGPVIPSILESFINDSTAGLSGNSTPRSYLVKQGDTLGEISMQTGVSVAALKKINNLKDTTVRVGQVLYLE